MATHKIKTSTGWSFVGSASSGSGGSTDTVYHGADANMARPESTSPVLWVGSVQPLNAVVGDVYTGIADVSPTNPLQMTGNQVKLVYRSANSRWEFPDGTVPDLVGRSASITWEGTAAQIPAQGTEDTSFKVGDTAAVRSTSL